MKLPYMGRALRGWTAPVEVMLVTKSVVNFVLKETQSPMVLDIGYQPMPVAQVNRKAEEQRTWLWWTIILKGAQAPVLKTDDQVVVKGLTFRIQCGVQDWSASGFSLYEAVQDFSPTNPVASS